MAGYSGDLRERVIRSWQNGHKPAWIAAEYAIGFSTVKRYITRYKRLGHVQATIQRRQSSQFTAEQLAILAEQVGAHDDATVDRHTDLWNQSQELQVSRSTMGRALQKLGWTRKKRLSEP
jgi:transposase